MNRHIPFQAVCDSTTAVETVVSDINTPTRCGSSAVMKLHLLGDFQLTLDDAPVMVIDVPRLQSLLAYLTLHHDVPQSRAHLAFLLWPDSTEAQARTNLRNLLCRLRQKLPDADHILNVDRHTLQWRNDAPGMLDVVDFERAVARADQAERQRDRIALRLALEQAARFYRGDLLPSCYDEWILPERDRLCQLFHSVLERLMMVLEEEGDTQEAIRVAQRLLRHDPLHEAVYRNLIRLYAAIDNRAAAERTYQQCVTVLERELAIEPSTATREVYEQYVQKDTAPAPASSSSLPFVLRVQNRWVKVTPERWMEVGKRASKTKRCFSLC